MVAEADIHLRMAEMADAAAAAITVQEEQGCSQHQPVEDMVIREGPVLQDPEEAVQAVQAETAPEVMEVLVLLVI